MAAAHSAQALLAPAGVQFDGRRAWDIQVHNPALFRRILRQGTLGLGEAYMEGWWDVPQLDAFFTRIFEAGLDARAPRGWRGRLLPWMNRWRNRQTPARSFEVARRHYDRGNEIFGAMLDSRMIYTAGRWEGAATLDQAQEAKLENIGRTLELQPGMTLLDVGCGWGGLARFMAERYGVRVVGITLSEQQLRLGREMTAGLEVELRLQDYRTITERFDRTVSLGMFEHVGRRNYATYFEHLRRALQPGGRFFLSTIGSPYTVRATDPWIERYIFPNSHLPSVQQMGAALEGRFLVREWQDRPEDYDRTLLAWWSNFAASWETWRAQFGEPFCRMWKYYLLSCAAAFRTRHLQDWHLLLEPVE